MLWILDPVYITFVILGREEKENPMEQSVATSSSSSHAENPSQV